MTFSIHVVWIKTEGRSLNSRKGNRIDKIVLIVFFIWVLDKMFCRRWSPTSGTSFWRISLGLSLFHCACEILFNLLVLQIAKTVDCSFEVSNDHVFRVALSFEVGDDLICVVRSIHYRYYSQDSSWTGQASTGSLTINPPVPGFQGPSEGSVNLIW